MKETVSPFVDFNRAWIVKDVIMRFFRAVNLNANIYREYHSDVGVSFTQLKQLSEILWDVKEELYLIYKRPIRPKDNVFEDAEKHTPSKAVSQFINLIGLLFHKVLVARELDYMLENYQTDWEEDQNIEGLLTDYIHRIKILFSRANTYLISFMAQHSSDRVMLAYIIENEKYVQSTLGIDLDELLQAINIKDGKEQVFVDVAHFLQESGWPDRAAHVIWEAKRRCPASKKVRELEV